MSDFSDSWKQCMRGNGFPVPDIETAREALEFVDQLHSAWEGAGAGDELLIGALLAGGALVGVDEAVLAFLGDVAEVAAVVYIGACLGCIGSVALDDLKGLFASGELQPFVVAELEKQGVDVTDEAHA
jgi:hypothetical protein